MMKKLWMASVIAAIFMSGCATYRVRTYVNPGEADVALAGDIMLGRNVEPLIEKSGVNYPFEGVAQYLKPCPVVFGNLEAPFVDEDTMSSLKKNGKKSVYLYASDSLAEGLKLAGFNVLSLANNHILDYGQPGLLQTMEVLDRHGIKYGGIVKGDLGKPNPPVIMEYNGVKVGFLCYSRVSSKAFKAGVKKYGTIPGIYKEIKRDIKNARPLTDVLIVYLHWGIEGKEVQKKQVSLAHGIIGLGADMVIGSHTHLFQDIEKYRGKYIFYGLGNFIFDMQADPTKYSAFVTLKILDRKISGVRITPVYLKDFRPEVITDGPEIDKFFCGVKLNNVKLDEIYGGENNN
jgi:poly-gamma-glutamate synthesis protein (capsule biosynthesis protein)